MFSFGGLLNSVRRAGISQPQRVTISRWVRTVMILIAIVGILNIIGLESETELLTLAGVGALVVGIALQGTLRQHSFWFSHFQRGYLTGWGCCRSRKRGRQRSRCESGVKKRVDQD